TSSPAGRRPQHNQPPGRDQLRGPVLGNRARAASERRGAHASRVLIVSRGHAFVTKSTDHEKTLVRRANHGATKKTEDPDHLDLSSACSTSARTSAVASQPTLKRMNPSLIASPP